MDEEFEQPSEGATPVEPPASPAGLDGASEPPAGPLQGPPAEPGPSPWWGPGSTPPPPPPADVAAPSAPGAGRSYTPPWSTVPGSATAGEPAAGPADATGPHGLYGYYGTPGRNDPPPGYGTYYGYGSGQSGPYGYGAGPPGRERTGRAKLIALVAVAALLVAALSAGISAVLATHGGSPSVDSPPYSALGNTDSGATATVAAKLDPAVVDVNTVVELASGVGEAAGTGMIVTSNGRIITNNHVVEDAKSIKVTIEHRGTFTATVVGTDSTADVAVLQVSGLSGLPTVHFGNSAQVKVGTNVVAIGNALGLGGSPTVTAGAITALGRAINAHDDTGASEHLTGMLQTDAQIQPGNSGGPLVTTSGLVIGMNTAAETASSDSPTSLGFAIPSNRFLAAASTIESGRAGDGVIIGLPAFLGIDGQTTEGVTGPDAGRPIGAEIIYVEPNSPASRAGIAAGDVITAFDGHSTPTIGDLAGSIHASHPGADSTVTFEGSSGRRTVSVVLGTGPAA